MKKQETVEVQYVKKTTMMAIAAACLVVGFILGMFYKNFLPSGPKVRRMTVAETVAPPAQDMQAQQQLHQLTALQKKADDNPKDPEAWTLLGNAYFDMERFADAIAAYKKSLELKPDNANVWTDLGIMYRRSNQPEEALKAFDKAIAIDPNHQQSRFNKGVVYLHDLQNAKDAVTTWQELLKVNPNATTPSGMSVKEMIEKLSARDNN